MQWYKKGQKYSTKNTLQKSKGRASRTLPKKPLVKNEFIEV